MTHIMWVLHINRICKYIKYYVLVTTFVNLEQFRFGTVPLYATPPSSKRPRQRAQRTRSIMSGRLSTPTDFETELQRIPSIKCALVTDLQGVVLLRAGSSTDEAALQQMARKLRVYPGAEHPHTAQQPQTLEI